MEAVRDAQTALRRVPWPVWVLVLAGIFRLAYGPGHMGHDAIWALVWGDQIIHGELPSYEARRAPTPHPLSNVVSAAVAPLGDAATDVVIALSYVAAGGLAYACMRLGTLLFSWPVGVLFAVLVSTRGIVLNETIQAILDIPFLALVVAAIVAEVRRPHTGMTAPLLLLLAALLRPEAWLVAAAYAVYTVPRRAGAERLRTAALLAAGPVIWALTDLLVTGDPLWSLHGTQDLAAELRRPRELDTALSAAPDYLRFALGDQVVWLAFAGAAAAIAWRFERAALPAAVVAIGLATFLALGVADLPLLIRYLFLPAVMLALFAAVATLGWTALPRGSREFRGWAVLGALGAIVLLAFLPRQLGALADQRRFAQARADVQGDLRRLTDDPGLRDAARACRDVWVGDPRPRPLTAYWLDRDPEEVFAEPLPPGRTGLVIVYATRRAQAVFTIGLPDQPPGPDALPGNARTVAANESFVAATVGC